MTLNIFEARCSGIDNVNALINMYVNLIRYSIDIYMQASYMGQHDVITHLQSGTSENVLSS